MRVCKRTLWTLKIAFDSVDRESLWNIMGSYGIPRKMVSVLVGIYEVLECAVIDGWKISDWFKIKSGVKQGCVMSEFLFLMSMGWIMRKTTTDERRGIRWNLTTVLEDLDFADDIALLSSKFKDLGVKTKRLTEEAAIVDREGGDGEDIRNRPQKARGAFQRPWKVWAIRGIRGRTKIRLFKT